MSKGLAHQTNSLIFCIIFIIALIFSGCSTDLNAPLNSNSSTSLSSSSANNINAELENSRTPDSRIEQAFTNQEKDIQVLVRGKVTRLLSDDLVGDKHQKFIIQLDNGQTLLIAHNIDIAPRVPNNMLNASIYVYGEYVWNSEGGLIHWTHKDPDGSHAHGYIYFNDVYYQ